MKILTIFLSTLSILFALEQIQDINISKKQLKYTTLKFIPVEKDDQTIFVEETEIELAVIKEFLEDHTQNEWFDNECIENSSLPDEAKDIKIYHQSIMIIHLYV